MFIWDRASFAIIRYSPDILIKQPLVTDIGKLNYANSKRFVNYNMHTSSDAISGIHTFETKLTYSSGRVVFEKKGNFSITVISSESDLAISRVATDPEISHANEQVILTIDVENTGNGEAKDVRVELVGLDFEGVKQKYLGSIDAGENLPTRFILKTTDSGIHNTNVRITYKQGTEEKELTFPIQIQVFERGTSIYLVIAVIIILGILAYYIIRSQRKPKK